MEELFLDLDKFFAYYTSLTTAPSDETPFRTVKTIIYHIVNIMGARVRNYVLGQICSLSSPPVSLPNTAISNFFDYNFLTDFKIFE